jgi:PKD repeat protein
VLLNAARLANPGTLSVILEKNKKIKIMKKLMTIVLILLSGIITASGQCSCNYSYSGTTDTLSFTNLSTVSNAHYYWNFGDGSGSNDVNPIHVFPDDGKYLVYLIVQIITKPGLM